MRSKHRFSGLFCGGALVLLWLAGCEASDAGSPNMPNDANAQAGAGGTGSASPDSLAGASGMSASLPQAGDASAGTAGSDPPTNVPVDEDPENDDAVDDEMDDDAVATPWPDPRGGCPTLDSGFPGDDACIAPPPAAEGFQIHIGPDDYGEPAQIAAFSLAGGAEVSECWSYHTPNTEEIYFQGYTLSGRPGTHHIFNSALTVEVTDGGGFHVCVDAGLGNSPSRLASLPGAAKPYMPRPVVAPENIGIGQRVPANTPAEADMHYFNTTDASILREFWLNMYFIAKEDVTQEAIELRGMGGLGWTLLPIAPATDQVYRYECPIPAAGRITSMVGHYHAHGERLTAHLRHTGGEREKLFEMYDYNNAAMFPFDSLTTNPTFSPSVDGARSGPLDVVAGDVLEWECHILNDGNVPLTYSNSVQNGEMCNVFGVTVGAEINCLLP